MYRDKQDQIFITNMSRLLSFGSWILGNLEENGEKIEF